MLARIASYGLLAVGALGGLNLAALLASGRVPGDGAALAAVLPLAFYLAGALAVWKRPAHAAAQRLLAVGSLHLVAFPLGAVAAVAAGAEGVDPLLLWVVTLSSVGSFGLGFAALLALYAVFPDGRYWYKHERPVVRATAAAAVLLSLVALLGSPAQPSVAGPAAAPGATTNPFWVPALAPAVKLYELLFLAPVIGLALLGLRYRCASPEQRLQMRWPLASAALLGVALLATGPVAALFGETVQAVTFVLAAAALPASIAIGMLRHHLFDIDLVIRRSLVHGVLWLAIALAYVALAVVLGLAAGQQFSLGVAVVVTIAVAMLFQPARRRLERLADRLVFGERLGGYELIRRFGATLENAVDPRDLAPRVAGTVRRGLDARWARVALHQTHEDPRRAQAAGLGGLRDRLEAVGGSLDVVAGPGRGTLLIGSLPARGRQRG